LGTKRRGFSPTLTPGRTEEEPVLEGLMQNDYQLTVRHVLERTRRFGADSELVTLKGEGDVRRARYPEVAARADRLASALAKLGIGEGDRVGTFMWNNQEHFEAYLAVPSMGAVLNTVNIRLFPEQVSYIINHAKDRVMFVDDSLVEALGDLGGLPYSRPGRDSSCASVPASSIVAGSRSTPSSVGWMAIAAPTRPSG
jgi:fatty-acyl-CoA synthase